MYLTCSSVKQTTKTHKEVSLPIQWKQPFPCKDRKLSQIQLYFTNLAKSSNLYITLLNSFPVHNVTTVLLVIGWQGKSPFHA